jgi:hypothetical protein
MRGKITPDEAKIMGGIDKADIVGTKFAKRSVMKALEANIRSDIMSGTPSATFDAAKFQTQAQTALESVRAYEGKTSLIASTMVLKKLVQAMIADDSLGAVFSRLISGTSPAVAASGMGLQAWLNGLAMFLGVDQVLAGCDDIWNPAATAGRLVIAKLDDGADELSYKYLPVLGKVYQFLPDGKNPWQVDSVGDPITISNLYTARLRYDTVILNSEAAYLMDGVV